MNFFWRLWARVIYDIFVRNSLQPFILFLPRGRKRTKQEKEAAARAKFASAHGAPPLSLKCLRHLFTKFLRQDAFLPLKAARRVGAPVLLWVFANVGTTPANFAQAGPLTASVAWSLELGAESTQRDEDIRRLTIRRLTKKVSPAAIPFYKNAAEPPPVSPLQEEGVAKRRMMDRRRRVQKSSRSDTAFCSRLLAPSSRLSRA